MPTILTEQQAFPWNIELALLRPDLTEDEIYSSCVEAVEYGIPRVSVYTHWLRLAGTQVSTVAIVAPFGMCHDAVKEREAALAVDLGASEIDVTINIAEFLRGSQNVLMNGVKRVVRAAQHVPVRVCIAAEYVPRHEHGLQFYEGWRWNLCSAIRDIGAKAIRTHSSLSAERIDAFALGYLKRSAEFEDRKAEIHVCGSVHTYAQAKELLDAGASRICSDRAVDIIKGYPEEESGASEEE